MLHSLTIFGESGSGLGALGLDAGAFVIQLITFVIVFWVLRRYAFKPILNVLQQRRQIIESGVKLGEQMQKEKAELEAKVAEALHKARTQADKIMSDAQTQSRQVVHEAEETARAKAEAIVAQADDRIKQDMARARRELEKELVELVAEATEVLIEEKVDPAKDAALIDKALRESHA